jgi:DNA topoisomerase-2
MRIIKVNINREEKSISIYNDGCGIPIVIHRDERIYVPEMIFGNLLTSSNYDDNKKKVTGGRNGYGAKLTNIFSTMFIVETANKQYGKKYKQVFTNNMTSREDPQITSNILQEFTRITFYPDFQKFHSTNFDDDLEALLKRRAYDIAGTLKGVNIFLNNKEVPIKNFIDYIQLYANSVKNADGSPTDFVYHKFNNRWEVGFAASEGQFHQVKFAVSSNPLSIFLH